MSRPFPWKCRTCGERSVVPKVVAYVADMEHDGRIYPVSVPNLDVLECDKCRAQELPSESHDRLLEALRYAADLLTPSQITAARESLKLTQKTFATMLGIAPATVSRWESGGQIQQRVMNDFMRAFFDLAELRRYLFWQRFPEAAAKAQGIAELQAKKLAAKANSGPSKIVDAASREMRIERFTPFELSGSASNAIGRVTVIEP